ncbi:hypothetical protein Ahy_A03g014831 isoform D [Arachis hypogaea]|uniref:Uncharacterized protein n=1 Tax=Arachis hypogaea TaxID=3818 RepID=A0A445DYT7_ARAHY|nr:hypothetical protein Ahy_A03g014831 isoform D [Arachis hypogaea]
MEVEESRNIQTTISKTNAIFAFYPKTGETNPGSFQEGGSEEIEEQTAWQMKAYLLNQDIISFINQVPNLGAS